MHIFADQISQIALSNGNLRIHLVQQGPENTSVEAGTLIIPVSQANNFVNGLANSLQEFSSRAQKQGENEGTGQ
jgi:phage-related tail protein